MVRIQSRPTSAAVNGSEQTELETVVAIMREIKIGKLCEVFAKDLIDIWIWADGMLFKQTLNVPRQVTLDVFFDLCSEPFLKGPSIIPIGLLIIPLGMGDGAAIDVPSE
jgi:hypothetical protein